LLGALAGAGLSLAYTTVIIPLVGILLVLTNIPSGKVFEALIGAGLFGICAWPFAILMGVFPGIVMGAISGIFIGLIILPLQTRITNLGAAIIGLTVAIGLVIGAHSLLYPGLIDMTRPDGVFKYLPYLFWLGFPSVLVLAGLTWVGWSILNQRS
jgi:hypothetical protein